jgi:hypothetical protein
MQVGNQEHGGIGLSLVHYAFSKELCGDGLALLPS